MESKKPVSKKFKEMVKTLSLEEKRVVLILMENGPLTGDEIDKVYYEKYRQRIGAN